MFHAIKSLRRIMGAEQQRQTYAPTWFKDVVPATTPDGDKPAKDGMLRLVCVSDTHGRTDSMNKIPDGDVLIHAGDFSMIGAESECKLFVEWLDSQPHRHKVVIAGNHDLSFDPDSYQATRVSRHVLPETSQHARLKESLGKICHYLQDSSVVIEGIHFYGSPWTPRFYNWAFNADRGDHIASIWKKIPFDTDVLITHGPPLGYGDMTEEGEHVGCVDLLEAIDKNIKPKVHVFGHIHEGHGAWTREESSTTYINASICTRKYQPTNVPIVFDVEIPTL